MLHSHLHLILVICLSIIDGANNANNANPPDYEEILTILQGERAQYAPWQARLLTDVRNPGSGYCGGTLIDYIHVLTALHCVCSDPNLKLSPSDTLNCTNIRTHVGVVLGDNVISEKEVSEVYATCSQIVLHPRGFDMAICVLDRNVSAPPAIQPIKLPPEGPPIGATVKTTGWGSMDVHINNTMADRLHEVSLRLANTCPFAHELCAEGMDRLSSFYQGLWRGDSGGPLVIAVSNSWYLVGVASAAELGQTASASYSKFVNVYTQKEWIQSITTTQSTCPESGILCESLEILGNTHRNASQRRCVIQPWLCDHVTDCANGEDEEDSVCDHKALLQRSSMSLFEAAQKGDDELVLSMLDAGMDVNSRDSYNYTVLHYAAQHNRYVLVPELLLYKADITARTYEGKTALMLATWADSRETALELIRHDYNINAAKNDNATALFGAAIRGDVQMADALLRKGALPNVMDIQGNTPLLWAVSNCDLEMMRLLLSRNADANFGSFDLPLLAVLKEDRFLNCTHLKQDAALEILLQHHADVNAHNVDGVTPLMIAARAGNLNRVVKLLQLHDDVNARNNDGQTALHYAAGQCNPDIVMVLLDHGIHINVRGLNNETELFNAASSKCGCTCSNKCTSKCSRHVLLHLLQHHADVGAQNAYGVTPLMIAARSGNLNRVEDLLQFPVDINARNNDGETALHYATVQCNVDIVVVLLDRGIDTNVRSVRNETELFNAVRSNCNNNSTVLLHLLKHSADTGIDVNSRDIANYTALHHAATKNQYGLVFWLLLYQADITARTFNGDTALMLATFTDSRETALELIQHDNNINACNNVNATALFGVAWRGAVQVADALLRKGALPNVMDIHGNTPLLLAASNCDIEMMQLLLSRNADANFGSLILPLHAVLNAYSAQKQAALELLLKYGANPNAPGHLPNGGALLTPLETAVLLSNSTIVSILLNHGADPNAVTKHDFKFWKSDNLFFNPYNFLWDLTYDLDYYVDTYPLESGHVGPLLGGNLERIARFLENEIHKLSESLESARFMHVNITIPEIIVFSALTLACAFDEADITRLLLARGANISAPDDHGITPLMTAAAYGALKSLNILLQLHADVNVRNQNGVTALHYAAGQCNTNIVVKLLGHGIDINVRNIHNETELSIAASRNCSNGDVLLHLLQHHADVNTHNVHGVTPLMIAARASNLIGVTTLLQFQVDIHVRDIYGGTALHYAAAQCNADVVAVLLDHGIHINVRDISNQTELFNAVHSNCTNGEVLLHLLQHHADVNAQNVRGVTPLMIAARTGNLNAVVKLLEFHADINVRDEDDETAWYYAAVQCNVDIVMVLLDHGIEINVRGVANETASHIAASSNCINATVLEYLLQHHADINTRGVDGITPLM